MTDALKRIWVNARTRFLEHDIELLELVSSMLLGFWGMWHVIPFLHTFDAQPGAWELLGKFASEPAWGALAMFLCVSRVNGVLQDDKGHRIRTAQWSFAIWLGALVSFAWHDISLIAVVFYACFAAADAWIFLRLTSQGCPRPPASS